MALIKANNKQLVRINAIMFPLKENNLELIRSNINQCISISLSFILSIKTLQKIIVKI